MKTYRIIMFMPVLELRYADMPLRWCTSLGQVPGGGERLKGMAEFSEPVSVDVPLATNSRRGGDDDDDSDDDSSSGVNVCVVTCVPATFTFHDLFHMSRIDIWPAWYCGSSMAPEREKRVS